MSSVSGSAAGNPSGMTAATAAAREHHWFPEPTEPARVSYVIWLFIAQFLFFVALLGPAIVGIGVKVNTLVASGAIPADGANGASAVLAGWGALFATVANVVFGRLSDRTASKWGRRRIWIVCGTAIMLVGLVVLGLAGSLLLATVGWSIAQLGANMTLAPFIATLADQVPKVQRGKLTAMLGIAQNLGVLGGTYVANWFLGNELVLFAGPAVLALAAMIVFAFVLPDKVLPVRPPRATFSDWWNTFWVSPAKHPDYALAWWSRFLVTFASFGFTTFRYFYLWFWIFGLPSITELSKEEGAAKGAEVVGVISLSVLINTVCLIIAAYAAGWLSDKIGKRKVFVWVSTVLFAIGTYVLVHIHDVPSFYVLEALMGIAYGIYVGVDLALVIDVLPNPDDSGKDLGVFNMANALPQTIAPLIGGILVYVGSKNGTNYPLWFTVCGVAALIGAAVIFPIKKVK